MVDVSKYTIHGCYGLGKISILAIVLVKFTLYLPEMYGRKSEVHLPVSWGIHPGKLTAGT